MAQSKQTSQEFIQNAFSPSVAVLCSSDAEEICQKNNLSFVELVQPFCRFNSEASFKDPMNQLCTIRNMRIIMRDINVQPPQQAVAKKMLNDVVSSCQLLAENNRSISVTSGEYEIQVPALLPWFEAYRDCFFDVIYPSDHEFTKHFLACVFVVSSSSPDPVAELTKLNQQQHQLQHQNPSKLPKWFLPNIFKGYIIVHDISEGDNAKAEAAFQNTKSSFPGSFCHLLQINSRSSSAAHQFAAVGDDGPQPPDPWYQFLSRKFDVNETSDYDSSPRTPQEDNIFPNKLSEGGSDLDITQITEVASEVTESSTETNHTFHHPLSPNNELNSSNYLIHDKMEKSIKVETISEEDAPLTGIINDTNISWTKEQSQSRPHGLCLTVSDLDRIRIFIHEFISRGMLPYVEKQMKFLHEAVATRKGLHRSLLSATKKWFVGNKPGFQGPGSPANMVVYSQEATELQVRRLGDLAFMFQHYDLAYQAYHTAKRDFNNDQAWLYFAGALEMAALSVFMLGSNSQRQYPFHYFETAIGTYLNACKSPQYATRATLLSTECLKSKGMYGEAAMQFIKMTSEDSDLRSALLLEQAAHCFIAMPSPMIRKYAFHMILAGHRFSKSGQRKHALRAYKQAHQVYKSKNWSLAEDHINFTIGRQSLNLKHLNQALSAFQSLLSEHSQQSASQQTAFLKEYLFVYNLTKEQNISGDKNFGHLPLPVIRSQSTKIMFGPIPKYDKEQAGHVSSLTFNDDEEQDRLWFKLEELIVEMIQKSPPLLFQPTLQRLTRFTNNCYKPLAVLKEPITVEIVMKNPFQIPLLLSNIYLLWRFIVDKNSVGDTQENLTLTNDDDDIEKMNKNNEVIHTETISELILECCHTEKVHLSMVPHQIGELSILGVSYELGSYSPVPHIDGLPESKSSRNSNTVITKGKQFIEICGPRLNNTKTEKAGKIYGPDYRLECIIIPPMPYLQVKFTNFPTNRPMLCGEIQQITVEFTNVGDDAITNLCVASPTPEIFSFGQMGIHNSMTSHLFSTCASSEDIYSDFIGKPTEISVEIPNINRVCSVPLPHGWKSIPPGKTCCLPMWIRGPDKAGLHDLQFLFYYEPQNKINLQTKYRIFRYTTNLTVYNSLTIKADAVHSSTQLTSDNTSSLSIAMEIENVSENQGSVSTEFTILQISSACKNWILQPIKNSVHQGIKINTRETAHMCLRAIKTHCQLSNQKESTLLFSNIPFENKEIDSSAPPCSDFCLRSCLKLPPLNIEDYYSIYTETSAPSSLITSSLKDIPYSQRDLLEITAEDTSVDKSLHLGITLIAVWKAVTTNANRENKVITGQHHITIDKINSSYQLENKQGDKKMGTDQVIEPPAISNDSSSTENFTHLVQTILLHPQHTTHNFSINRTCTISVTFIIHNCSEVGLDVIVDTSKINSSAGSIMKNSVLQPSTLMTNFLAPIASAFTWIGPTHTCLTLLPGETSRIPLKACFFSPGTYNLGSVYIGARYLSDSDDNVFQQSSGAPSLITINSECHPS